MKKLLTLALTLVALAAFTGLGIAQEKTERKKANPEQQVDLEKKSGHCNCRAGTAKFKKDLDGIDIIFSTPMPTLDYAVVVQETNTAGPSPTSVCTYFNPLHKRLDGFEVQHKRCDDGVPVKLDDDVSLDYIAIVKTK